ncbi:hypothetical protein IMCC3135_07775 [Granulosicoccus antarcticus IMCC3135]|uniref:Integrase catalytic domain-containing protein n=2 Tax=Granulosicoccus TaxID=437504 RepID=A0A2Z2NSE8_9GAMM|nr:hypothetical protein IMCC3135_07775 [Granulosicoccus antarcticus IMCC3135]
MSSRTAGDSQQVASAKAGISVRSGRRIDKGERTEPDAVRQWRTRTDPLKDVWQSECVPLLEREPELTGLTLWEHLEEIYPAQYPFSLLRTLQRRVKKWQATDGPAKAVMFRQAMPPGLQGLSDFTVPNSPVTIAGEPFEHLLYQFRLAYSGWRSVTIIRGGESYSALADGLQSALRKLGGAPLEHRSDSLSAAYVNASQKRYLTDSYNGLCQHYGMRPTTNNLGVSHENGAIESAHGALKHRIDQALKLRGSSDFSDVRTYRVFLFRIVEKLNKRSRERLGEERAELQALPMDRFIDYRELSVRVTTSSTIDVKRTLYTVPSQLMGEKLRIHLYHDRLQCYLGQTKVLQLPRVYPDKPDGRARRIDYSHIIHSLVCKPQAFRFCQFRDDILPGAFYRQLWSLAEAQFTPQMACKWIVNVLRIAHDYDCEQLLVRGLLKEAEDVELPTLETLQSRYLPRTNVPPIPVRQHCIIDYDELLEGQWTAQEACHG